MKIVVTAETDEEKSMLAAPWVRTGVQCFGLSGRMNPKIEDNFEFGFVHGPWPKVRLEMTRLLQDFDAIVQEQNAVKAVLQAHNAMAEAHKNQQLLSRARNGAAGIVR